MIAVRNFWRSQKFTIHSIWVFHFKVKKIALTLGTGATAEIKLHLLVIFYFVRLFTFNLAYAMKL